MAESSNSSSSSPLSSSIFAGDLVRSIFSYNANVMLAALVSFLFVLLFVFLLHFYARRFFAAQGPDTRRRHRRRFSEFRPLAFDSSPTNSPTKGGLNPSAISLIPLFVYESEKKINGLECVICLSDFEDSEIGRRLPKCSHAFHLQCIDMWLSSHSRCPICRAPAAYEVAGKVDDIVGLGAEE